PTLLPGGRPAGDPSARVDAATAWGVPHLPETAGRDADAIVAALTDGSLGGVVVGGVDPDDTADPAATLAALDAASFVVSLELRETEVTRRADVVLPVAPVTDKAGTFVTWEGRPRPFEAVFTNPGSLPDLRVLSGISEELAALGQGSPLGFRTVPEVRSEMEAMGPWDGARPDPVPGQAPRPQHPPAGALALSTWKQHLDAGSMQDGDANLALTRRPAVARVSPGTLASIEGTTEAGVLVTGDRGAVTVPVEVVEGMVDGVVWLPTHSLGRGLLADLASPGSTVTLKGAGQ
ncbi:molybdopterin-dependent oxidoreductase, partial [Nocardioides sp. P5_C9_2]